MTTLKYYGIFAPDRSFGLKNKPMSTETRATILQTARRLFVRLGFTATSIRQLAKEAGIGKATIYHHFKDKQAIALALLDHELVLDEGDLAALRAEPDPRRRIEMAVHYNIAVFQQSMELIMVVQREIPAVMVQLNAKFFEYYETFTMLIADAIIEGQAEGIYRTVDAAQAAQVLITMILGLVGTPLAMRQPTPTPEESTAILLNIFWHGIEV